jgi:amino acid transporter
MAFKITNLKTHWRLLLQVSTWLLAILSSFILVPPIWDFKEDATWFGFTHFLVAALVGLSFLPISKWSKRKHKSKWWVFTVLSLIVGSVIFFAYQSLRAAWTVDYNGTRAIVGQTYTPDALNYKAEILAKEHRAITNEELLLDYAGQTEHIWLIEEIHRRRLILAGIYVALIAVFAVTIISIIQAL